MLVTTSELMKAMADAGAPFEAILIAVQALEAKDAEIAAREAEIAQKRAGNAERQQRFRERRNERKEAGSTRRVTRNATHNVTRNVTPPIENNHTPSPDISPDGESQERECDRATPDDCDEVVSAWNAMAKATGLPTCVKFSPQRRKACRARLREDGLQAIRSAIDRVPHSAFLRGEAGGWSGASLDFLLRPDSVTKILEGKYDDRTRPHPAQHDDEHRNPYVRAVIARQSARAAAERGEPGGWAEDGSDAFCLR